MYKYVLEQPKISKKVYVLYINDIANTAPQINRININIFKSILRGQKVR